VQAGLLRSKAAKFGGPGRGRRGGRRGPRKAPGAAAGGAGAAPEKAPGGGRGRAAQPRKRPPARGGRRRGEKGLLHMRVGRPRRGGDVSKTTQKRRSFLSCNLAEKERRWRCAGKTGPRGGKRPPRKTRPPPRAAQPPAAPARPPSDRDRLPARPQPSGAVWPRRPAPASLLERALWVPTTTNPFRPGPRREARKGKAQNERRNPE